MQTLTLYTGQRDQYQDLTDEVRDIVKQSGVKNGYVIVYVPHTTAGVTINENADPDVIHDTLAQLDKMIPWSQPFYRHGEGNSASHIKASLMGSSATVLIEDGRLVLGTWQGIFFCEFDGPRSRKCYVKVVSD